MEGIVGIPLREFNEALSLTIGRWWKLLERHSNFLNQTVRERIAIALLDLGRKFGVPHDREMLIDLRLSGQDIADLVECSRPKASECLKKLSRKFGLRDDRGMIIDLRLSGQDIADLVDCSRSKASECLKKLVAEGLVRREHRRFIIDSAKIETSLRS